MLKNKKINVTQPSLPSLSEFIPYLESIWEDKWLTNNGKFHKQLESELEGFLGVEHVALCSNGTFALILALKALNIKDEVITTPFSFVATSHAISWNGCSPVFADIDPDTFNLDPNKVEDMITENTTAIMPVHVYGKPCDNIRLKEIARKHDLKLIYDAAHAFHVRKNGESILQWGDLSILSFHATKVFNTFEGGAVICHTPEMKQKICDLKNFGIQGETSVVDTGINAKMNEVQASMGLLQLKYLDDTIEKRRTISDLYDQLLYNVQGITLPHNDEKISQNYSYYPILIDEAYDGRSRDQIYEMLKTNNIFSRRYFYPLISHFPMYASLSSAAPKGLPVAERVAQQVLCLPIYPELSLKDVRRICKLIINKEKH
ncbi:MAG: DegT/DnrJ/EryC1/StrS family aminotransferase [Candidatus Marinimicrobia bacterium]|nr:DegT/DnrJ/EryC1/StrS family aminotransferase [Candidatus Neomarinimicrobiota bacterium]